MLRPPFILLAVIAAASGCAGPTSPKPVARASGTALPSVPIGSSDRPAGRPLDRFAARIGQLAIDELSMVASDAEAPCRGVAPPFVVLSALTDGGEGVSCLVGRSGAACVNFVDHDTEQAEQTLCGETGEAVDVPTRVRAVAQAADSGWRVAPIPAPTGYRALSLRAGNEYYLLVRRGHDWIASPRPVGTTDGDEVGPERVLDSRQLTDDPSFAVVSSSYRGSKQKGELTTRLFILSDDLSERAVRDIGLLVWTVDPAERERDAGGDQSPRGGPHLEVLLEPSITADGLLRLEGLREHRPEPDRRRFQHDPCAPGGDGDLLGLACPVSRLDLIERDTGFWRFDRDGGLVRNRR